MHILFFIAAAFLITLITSSIAPWFGINTFMASVPPTLRVLVVLLSVVLIVAIVLWFFDNVPFPT